MTMTNRSPNKRSGAAALLTACALFATACQPETGAPPVLSLQEATQATMALETQTFTPPPRSIADIASILDSQKQADTERSRKLMARADAQMPDGKGRGGRIKFFNKRGMAALKIGRSAQAIEDLSRASQLAEGARRMQKNARARLLNQLAEAKFLGGAPRDAMEDLRRAIGMNENSLRGAFWSSRLAIWLALSGDLAAADDMIARAEQEISTVQSAIGRRAAKRWDKNGLAILASVSRASARLLMMRGDFAGAEKRLRQALAGMASYQQSAAATNAKQRRRLVEYIQGDLGMAMLRQDRYLEAEVEIRAALDSALKRTGRYGPEVARFAANLASVMDGQGRPGDAEKLARAALEILQTIGSESGARLVGLARIMLGKSLAAQERWAETVAEMEPLFAADADRDSFVALQSGAVFALALLQQGKIDRAAKVAAGTAALLKAQLGRKHRTTAEAVAILAMAQARTGKHREALRNFANSIPILLSRSRASDDETDSTAGSARLLSLIFDAYIRLLSEIDGTPAATEAGLDAAAEAFRIADAARAGRVQKALAASAARAAARDGALAELARREQDAIKRIGALNGLFAAAVSVPESQRDPTALTALRTRIDTLRGARATLTQEIERRFPDYARLMAPRPARIADVRPALRDGEALIATYVGPAESFVWAITRSGPVRFARIPLGRDRLAAAIRDLRTGVTPTTATLDGIPAFDVRLAHKLYSVLLAPVRDGWKDARDLLIVAHESLGQLPFSLLVTDRPTANSESGATLPFTGYRKVAWLARTHAVTVLPSVGSLATLRAAPPPAAGRRDFVGFGDPVFDPARSGRESAATQTAMTTVAMRGGPTMPLTMRAAPRPVGSSGARLSDLPRLPDTAPEIRGMALALNADPTRDVFIGSAASEQQVRGMDLSGYRVVAFATHGLVPGDLDGLTQPALALSAPQSVRPGPDTNEDGLLTMGEILGLRLDADWVVLSACNTASGQGAGAEAVSGLGRAFFYAGTRALLVSNWPVETTSARALTTDLFRRQAQARHTAGLGRAEALRRAMVALIDEGTMTGADGLPAFSYAHPLFWAPFSLVGDGGGAPAN